MTTCSSRSRCGRKQDLTAASVSLGTAPSALLPQLRAASYRKRRAAPSPEPSPLPLHNAGDLPFLRSPERRQLRVEPVPAARGRPSSTLCASRGEGDALHLVVMFTTCSLTPSSTACFVVPVHGCLDGNRHFCCACVHNNLCLKNL